MSLVLHPLWLSGWVLSYAGILILFDLHLLRNQGAVFRRNPMGVVFGAALLLLLWPIVLLVVVLGLWRPEDFGPWR